MDKETEIKHLKALADGDTYFAQFFSKSDVERMVYNIKNDFPIELDCAFVAKSDALEKALKKSKENADQEKFDIAVAFLRYIDCDELEPFYKMLKDICGSPLRIIEAKTAAGIAATREEVEYLIRCCKERTNTLKQ